MLRFPRSRLLLIAVAVGSALALAVAAVATVVSSDPYSNSTSQHKTEVEPDTFSYGSTIVAAFQVGRFYNGGASNIGWATSTNGGGSWTYGFLPGTTKILDPANPYDRVSDPSVAYDAGNDVWLINSLPLVQSGTGVDGEGVVVSRSTNGGLTWSNPVMVKQATGNQDFDKNWIVCDNTSSSPHYGTCYVQWDDFGSGNRVHVAYSTDGGLNWTEGSLPAVSVIGGQPVVQPDGDVVMPIDTGNESSVISLVSTDGGHSWSGPYTIDRIYSHGVRGGLRTGPLPSAEVDGAGTVYVVWQDCRFRTRCSSNDIVMSTSSDGQTWGAVTRIPIDSVSSTVDHFIPGLAVDKSTSGSTAHLALAYYYYPNSKCTGRTGCQLYAGYVSSTNGGSSWSTPTQLAGPMNTSWLPNTSQGRMVGDYISTSFAGGNTYPVLAVANAPTSGGSDCATATPNCDVAMNTPASPGLAATGGTLGSADLPVANPASDHAAPQAAFFR